jgi:hypothetical protein
MIVPGSGRQSLKEIRTFGTMTDNLLELADWLAAEGVTHVAMESTGVFWKPIFTLLEDRFQLMLVNARHIKQVPGRKTDVKECEWITDLLPHGLLKASSGSGAARSTSRLAPGLSPGPSALPNQAPPELGSHPDRLGRPLLASMAAAPQVCRSP